MQGRGPPKATSNPATSVWKQPLASPCIPVETRYLAEDDGQGRKRIKLSQNRGANAGQVDSASTGPSIHPSPDGCNLSSEAHASETKVKSRWATRAASNCVPYRARGANASPSSSVDSIPESLQDSSDVDADAMTDLSSTGTQTSPSSPESSVARSNNASKLQLQTVGKRLCKKLK